MDTPLSALSYRIMLWMMRKRDHRDFTDTFLSEIPLGIGMKVVDFGFGRGSFTFAASEIVGKQGHIYAVDIHKIAITKLNKRIKHAAYKNITPILSSCETSLEDNAVDVVLLYDIFHHLSEKNKVLQEIYRILKPNGILSFSDHHLQENEILHSMANFPYFLLEKTGRKTFSFVTIK